MTDNCPLLTMRAAAERLDVALRKLGAAITEELPMRALIVCVLKLAEVAGRLAGRLCK